LRILQKSKENLFEVPQDKMELMVKTELLDRTDIVL
jgi:hypothetical protein